MTVETAQANLAAAVQHLGTLYGTSSISMIPEHQHLTCADLEESITTLVEAAS